MKKWICSFLTFVMLLSVAAVGPVFSADSVETTADYGTKAAEFLGVLGFRSYTANSSEEMTRGSFISEVLSMLKISKKIGRAHV